MRPDHGCIDSKESGALLRSHAQSLGHRAVGPHDSVLEIDNGDEVRDGVERPFPLVLGVILLLVCWPVGHEPRLMLGTGPCGLVGGWLGLWP